MPEQSEGRAIAYTPRESDGWAHNIVNLQKNLIGDVIPVEHTLSACVGRMDGERGRNETEGRRRGLHESVMHPCG